VCQYLVNTYGGGIFGCASVGIPMILFFTKLIQTKFLITLKINENLSLIEYFFNLGRLLPLWIKNRKLWIKSS